MASIIWGNTQLRPCGDFETLQKNIYTRSTFFSADGTALVLLCVKEGGVGER